MRGFAGLRLEQFVLGCIFRTWILRFCNLSWGASFALVENFGNQQTISLVLSQNFLQIQNLHRHYFDCDYAKANQLRLKRKIVITRSLLDSAESQNLKSFCYFLLLQKVESSLFTNFKQPNNAILQESPKVNHLTQSSTLKPPKKIATKIYKKIISI